MRGAAAPNLYRSTGELSTVFNMLTIQNGGASGCAEKLE